MEGHDYIAVPHNAANTIALQEAGADVPAAISLHYTYSGTPFVPQRKTAEFLTTHKRAYCLSDPGCGKTRAVAYALDWLRRFEGAGKAFIVAPLSTLTSTWVAEVEKAAAGLKVAVLHGSRKARLAKLAGDADIFVINHDGVGMIYDALLARVTAGEISHIIVDELSVYRNPAAKRSKQMAALAARAGYVWGLSGSPVPNSPLDAWAQMRIVTPDTTPDFAEYRNLVCEQFAGRWVRKPDAAETVRRMMTPAIRHSLDAVTELPGFTTRFREIPLTPAQKQATKDIKAAGGHGVPIRLHQASLGWVRSGAGAVAVDASPRIAALLDEVSTATKGCVVFAPYRAAIAGIAKALTDAGIKTGVIHGGVSAAKRTTLIDAFQRGDLRALVCHPRCCAHGLTLTAANRIVWFGAHQSAEAWSQGNARIYRAGQDMACEVVCLYSGREDRIYQRHMARRSEELRLLGLYEAA